jgi:hypothetical protein
MGECACLIGLLLSQAAQPIRIIYRPAIDRPRRSELAVAELVAEAYARRQHVGEPRARRAAKSTISFRRQGDACGDRDKLKSYRPARHAESDRRARGAEWRRWAGSRRGRQSGAAKVRALTINLQRHIVADKLQGQVLAIIARARWAARSSRKPRSGDITDRPSLQRRRCEICRDP